MEELPYFNTITAKDSHYLANFKPNQLYRKMAEVIAAYATKGKIEALFSAAKGAIMIAVGQKDSVEKRVFKLFSNAVRTACLYSLLDKRYIDYNLYAHQIKKLVEEVNQDVTTLEIKLSYQDLTNFDNEALALVVTTYEAWLVNAVHLDQEVAQQISNAVRERFLDFLDMEWAREPAYYALIEECLKTPFSEKRLQRGYLLNYYEGLKQLFHQPALGDELLPLSTIYQEPDFLVYKKCLKRNYASDKDGFAGTEQWYHSLHEYLTIWLMNQPSSLEVKGKQLLILLGQPGQGKSSFCYKTLSVLLENASSNKTVYFIRLRDLSFKTQLIKAPFVVFENYLKKKTKLSTINFEHSILLLDGLDELYMSEGLTNQDLKQLYEHLEHQVEQEEGLKLILTSRYNYLNVEGIDKEVATIVKLAPLSFAKQETWLSIYKEAHPTCLLTIDSLRAINSAANLEHIKELIEQPILLHLIARSEVVIDAHLDRAKIYEELFDAVIHRSWADKQLKKFKNLTEEEHSRLFRAWLQEIAFTIYQSDQEYIHHDEIKQLESAVALNSILDTPQDMEHALKELLVVFYFRNVADGKVKGAHPIEFLHKSLQEYLAVEYIWATIQELTEATPALDDVSIFKEIASFFSQKILNENMRQMLLELIEHTATATRLLVRNRLKKALPCCLKHQFLYAYKVEQKNIPPLTRMENCFKSFWFLLVHLAENKEDNQELLSEEVLGGFSRLIVVFGGIGMNLSWLSMMSAKLSIVDLSFTDLSNSNLRSADLRSAKLSDAKLSDVKLNDAILSNADLSNAILISADLSNTDLRSANLSDTNLMSAKLKNADLRSANFGDSNLISANLSNSNLSFAKLRSTKLRSADLRFAKLRSADLRSASLHLSKTNDLNFFQTLKQQNCLGVEGLIKKYQVDPTPHYEDGDIYQTAPYYIIKERKAILQ